MIGYYDVMTFISNFFILRRPRAANFAEIFKLAATFTKITFKD